jgi:glycosyltransferase involved in cell wall biosynthesis
VFADDWGRHPSSCQHLIRHLLAGHEVIWVNTIGTRRPALNLATFVRGLEKLRHWLRPSGSSEARPANLRVLNPKMLPWFNSAAVRKLNRELLLRQLGPVLRALPEPPVAVTTLPIVADLVGLLPVARWVYYCVDDFSLWPGLDQAAMRAMEDRLLVGADTLIAASENLRQRLAERGRTVHLLTHGIEPGFWEVNGHKDAAPLDGYKGPFIIFWGVIDRRMDVEFIKRLAADLESGTIVLVGPLDNPDPALLHCDRVVHIPPRPYHQLPHIARGADVLMMPYADLPVTQVMEPLKLKEYLATGKPAVVRKLPAALPWADCLDLAETPESFSETVRLRLAEGLPEHQKQARARLAGESWAEKARKFKSWVLSAEPCRNGVTPH